MKTFGQIIRENNHTTGFDYLRLMLAVGIVAWHSYGICAGMEDADASTKGWMGYIPYFLLPPFFALSGFLVMASLLRCRTSWEFVAFRALRVFPALMVETCLSAMLLGPLLTTFSLKAYFSSPDFRLYFGNCIAMMHYFLPGVFLENPIPKIVNGSLWTIQYECGCYILLFALAVFGIARRPKLLLTLFAGFCTAILIYKSIYLPPPAGANVKGRQLILFFVAGLTLYLWRDKVPHLPLLLIASFLICLALIKSSRLIYVTTIPLAYIIAYIGLLNPKKLPVLFTGDYSYGIYLYAFPMQQALCQLLPSARIWYLHFPLSLALAGLFAVFSWHAIEKRALRLKDRLKRKEKITEETAPRSMLQKTAA